MKENKKFGWLVGLVCVMLCLSVCLVACGGKNEPTEPSETAGTTSSVTETTGATEATLAPTEATVAVECNVFQILRIHAAQTQGINGGAGLVGKSS